LPTAVSAQDKIGRVDITDMKLVTIDGEDSRDFDDAVFAESTGNGWKLVVATPRFIQLCKPLPHAVIEPSVLRAAKAIPVE
jgi:hypothetical protein